jgi:hypothetical protein
MSATPAQLEAARAHGERSARAAASWTTTDPVKAKLALRTLASRTATRSERAQVIPARPTIQQGELAEELGIVGDAVGLIGEGKPPLSAVAYDELGAAWAEGVEAAFLPACKQRLEQAIS